MILAHYAEVHDPSVLRTVVLLLSLLAGCGVSFLVALFRK